VDVGDVRHPELIDARPCPVLGYIRVDWQPVLGVGGEKKLSSSQTQQVILPHQPQNAFVIYAPALAQQFGMHTTIAIGRPSERDALDLVAQIHVGCLRLRSSPETVVSGPTHSRCPAEPVHGCPRFDRFPDLLIELAPPLAMTGRGCSLKRRNAFFKKSSSIACCPILRSSSAIRSASSRLCGRALLPGNASSPLARHSPFQVSSRLGY
jgi:hypothetical protein